AGPTDQTAGVPREASWRSAAFGAVICTCWSSIVPNLQSLSAMSLPLRCRLSQCYIPFTRYVCQLSWPPNCSLPLWFCWSENSRRPVNVRFSKYDVWQQRATQRLRRGVPSIFHARRFMRQVDKIRAQEETDSHRPLMTMPSRHPPILHRTQRHASQK
ncbi:hypothetical protein P4O66_021909, partial [Electrophorus voltai]